MNRNDRLEWLGEWLDGAHFLSEIGSVVFIVVGGVIFSIAKMCC